jgi:flagellar biosynthesis/type III secretory pathway protein FliH
MSKYINPYTDFGLSWDITNAMNDAESKGFKKGKKEGEKIGIEKGRAEGRTEQLVESIKNLISGGFDFDRAIEMLKVPADQISELKCLVFR